MGLLEGAENCGAGWKVGPIAGGGDGPRLSGDGGGGGGTAGSPYCGEGEGAPGGGR